MKKDYKGAVILLIIATVIAIMINRIITEENRIVDLRKNLKYYTERYEEAKKENKKLKDDREKSTTDEFIEKNARNKLDMFFPNERIYIYDK